MQLAARFSQEMNQQRVEDDISYARKAVVIIGMAFNANGLREVKQLTPELQRIVARHRSLFDSSRGASMPQT